MGWTLLETDSGHELVSHPLPIRQSFYLASKGPNERLSITPAIEHLPEAPQALGRIDVGPWGAKLVALGDDITVQPKQPQSNHLVDPPKEGYKLKRASDGQSEVIFLRDHDSIFLSKTAASLTLAWNSPEVQVNSSATGEAEIPESENHQVQGQEDEETEDEDLDRTLTAVVENQSNPQPSRSTPMPSVPRSEVVQETPTADRLNRLTEFTLAVGSHNGNSDTVESTPPPGDAAPTNPTGPEIFSTAPTKPIEKGAAEDVEVPQDVDDRHGVPRPESPENVPIAVMYTASSSDSRPTETSPEPRRSSRKSHPQVHIPAKPSLKRVSPMPDNETESNASSSGRPSKQLKTGDDESQDSQLSTINVVASARKSAPKRGKRVLSDVQEATPSRTTKSSQQSLLEDLYQGPKPRVAFSNSAIQSTSPALKFLKKHGGLVSDSVKSDECNILCVRDHTLRKSMKLLLCVALGIPIVADNWLTDSAKEGRFLDLKAYKPTVTNQEREWNFSLERIWSIPQTEILKGYQIYFTPSLKLIYNPFTEVGEVCKAVGARRTVSKPGSEVKDSADTIILALEEGDKDAQVLMQNGHTCYSKDFLTLSILRGEVDLESDEFKIKPVASQPKKKGRPRKS